MAERQTALAPEHPQRVALANEVHARPPEILDTPSQASYIAMLVDHGDRASEIAHLAALCVTQNVNPPQTGASHFSARVGAVRVKWERHGEFSGYTFIVEGTSVVPFAEPAVRWLPPDWLAGLPGRTLVAVHAEIVSSAAAPIDATFLTRRFGDNPVIGGDVGDGAGSAYTDFRIHGDSFARILLVDHSFTARQAGRMLQRLFEIEAYRLMALLALPVAREQSANVAQIEAALALLATDMAVDGSAANDEALLHKVTHLAAEVESGLANSQFRFNACAAYSQLVTTRIAELREQRLSGIQPVGEFMARRFMPAVATCATVSQRLHDASQRVARATALLSTRVDIARERQNQALLASMDRRARAQLRLQETVEGLSIAAIVYYAAGLVSYMTKAIKTRGVALEPDLIVGVSIPLLFLLVWAITRRARKKNR